MKKVLLLIIMCIAILNLSAERYVISVPYESREQLQEYIKKGYDIAYVNPGKEIHIVIHESQRSEFMNRYSDVQVVFTETDMKNNLTSSNKRLTGYTSYTDIVQKLFEYEETYPDLCQVIELGPSQGKLYFETGNTNYSEYDNTIYGIKLSKNVTVHEDEPNYLFMGNIHAREPLTAEICMHIIKHLIETYDIYDEYHPLNQSQIWIIPVKNPDGRDVVFTQKDIWHRKTIFDNNDNGVFDYEDPSYWGYNIDGIDGNRNYAHKWGTTGISWDFWHPTYPGTEPFSAVETAYIRDLAAKIPFVAGIDYHSYGDMVLWPYGYIEDAISHNHEVLSVLGTELANLIPSVVSGQQYYLAMPSWGLYPASGTTPDYLHYYHNILAFTLEAASEFIPPAGSIPQLVEVHIPAVMHLLNRHLRMFVTGIVTDKITGEPLKAEIKVFPLDSGELKRMPLYSSEDFGRYHYALMQGSYKLSVTKDEYEPYLADFTTSDRRQTIHNVQLVPITNSEQDKVLNYHTVNVSVYPNPFNPMTTFSLDITRDSNVKIEIFNIKGQKIKTVADKYLKSGNHKYIWNGQSNHGEDIPSGLYLYKVSTGDDTKTGKLLLLK